MCLALNQKLIHSAAAGCREQKLTRVGIEEFDLPIGLLGKLDKGRLALKVSRVFCTW